MTLSEHSLRQIDEESIDSLSEDGVRALAIKLLNDLKEARERLNRNSQNSSVSPGSEAPREKGSKYADDENDADASLEPEGIEGSDSDSSEEAYEEQQPEKSSQTQTTEKNEPARKPGKQPGAQGFGRVETIPVHGQEHHYPDCCACCGQAFSDEQNGIAYTAFDQLDIQWGDADRPGIAVFNTRHVYYESECQCGHTTREAPCRQPPDERLERVELSQWRLVGPGQAALIVCLFYRIRLSRQRIREFLHDWLEITFSVGTINKVIHESGRAAMPVEDELVNELRQSTLAYVDERALRHCVILRRISHGTKTHQGSRIFAILASVIETCRLRSCSPWRYPEAVITAGRAGLPVPALPVAA